MLKQPRPIGAARFLLRELKRVTAKFDFRYRRIPNCLVRASIVAGFAWNLYSSGWSGPGHAATGFGLGFGSAGESFRHGGTIAVEVMALIVAAQFKTGAGA